MQSLPQVIVEAGPDRGKEIAVPVAGVRLGRSSRNDVVLMDPSLSRFHCRLSFKPGKGLWVTDLGSANQTLVNGTAVLDAPLHSGDRISLGDTILKVLDDGRSVPAAGESPPAGGEALPPSGVSAVTPEPPPTADEASDARRRRIHVLLAVAVLMAIVSGGIWLRKLGRAPGEGRPVPAVPPTPGAVEPEPLPPLELRYEKVFATSSNIFRYSLELGNRITVQIDDLNNKRHVRREKQADPDLASQLASAIQAAGFFDLLDEYQGLSPNAYELLDLSVTVDRRTRRTRVINHTEPETFRSVRELIEEFAKNTLGLAALALEPAQLIEMARESALLGRKLYDEKEIRHGNLFLALRSFKEAEIYLETIEPKPEFYRDAVNGRTDCEREIQTRYDNLWFLAERAVKLRDWAEGARNLKIICELIPDRSDKRNRNAFTKLVEVERHLESEKK